jgi:hypothetical protein
MTFSATDAAFEGFRLVRRHPLTAVFWSLGYLVFFGLMFGVFGSGLASVMAATETLQQAEPTTAELEALSRTYLGLFGTILPLSLVLGTVLNAAVARAVVRPADKAFGFLRLGMDELRVFAVSVALSIVFVLVSFILFAIAGFGAGLSAAASPGLGVLVGVLLFLPAVAVLIWLAVRLSLAVPITVAERRIALFDSFALTKGHSLSLLGMAIIAFIMSMLVGLLFGVVALPVTMLTGDINQLAALDGASTAQILNTAGPAIAGFVVVNAIASALQLAVLYAPFASAYLGLKGLPSES